MVRGILYQMGGIESVFPLPDDPTFNKKDNHYNVTAYKKICADFNVDPNSDFCFTHGQNHGLGNVYIGVTYKGLISTDYNYPDPDLALFDDECMMDRKDPNYRTNGTSFVRNDQSADKQFEYFVPNYSQGITKEGQIRINNSIEAFVYCILGSQAATLSSILDGGDRSGETQKDFHKNMESAIINTDIDIEKSIQRYREAIVNTKTRFNFAVAQGTWLMPSRMINTETIVGYNNELQSADETVKLGVNNNINLGTKKPH